MSPADLHLIAPSPDYAAAWLAWRGQPDAVRHNPFAPTPLDALRARLAACSDDPGAGGAAEVRWFARAGGDLVGTVALSGINRNMGTAEISYQIDAAFQGRGFGTAAVAAAIDRTFAASDLQRLYAFVATENAASRRLLDKLGFTLEGVLRGHYVIQGRRVDEAVYGLLRTEWRSRPVGRRRARRRHSPDPPFPHSLATQRR